MRPWAREKSAKIAETSILNTSSEDANHVNSTWTRRVSLLDYRLNVIFVGFRDVNENH